jgi:hypothetical protein
VIRGGGWLNTGNGCRSAIRYGYEPTYINYGMGFRVVLAPAAARAPTGFADLPSFVVNLIVNQAPPPWIGSCRYLTNGGFRLEFNGTE